MRSRETVNTMVNSELKKLIEATKGVHNQSFGELLDKAMLDLLMKLNYMPVPVIDQEIAKKGMEISRLTQEQADLIALKEKIKNIKLPVIEDINNGNKQEEHREERFQKSKETYLKEWEKNRMADRNWERIVHIWGFKNKKEALEWFEQRIEKETGGIT